MTAIFVGLTILSAIAGLVLWKEYTEPVKNKEQLVGILVRLQNIIKALELSPSLQEPLLRLLHNGNDALKKTDLDYVVLEEFKEVIIRLEYLLHTSDTNWSMESLLPILQDVTSMNENFFSPPENDLFYNATQASPTPLPSLSPSVDQTAYTAFPLVGVPHSIVPSPSVMGYIHEEEFPACAANAIIAPHTAEALQSFKASADAILDKKAQLPEDLYLHAESIYQIIERILHSMTTDPEDWVPGEQFLSRYLPSVHTLLDEQIRLTNAGTGYKNVESVLVQNKEMLLRLRQAFMAKHESLLENDTMRLANKLHTLDTLLKTQGR